MLVLVAGCGKQEIPKETKVDISVNNEEVDLIKTVWASSVYETEKLDSWSVEGYIEDFFPQITDGVLGTHLYAMDGNVFWSLSEVWKALEIGNKSREYQMTQYDIDLAECETFLFSLKWDETIAEFDDLIQGIEQFTYHIVGMDCVDSTFSLLVEGLDEERNIPLFYVVYVKADGQVLEVTDISDVLLENNFNCAVNTKPSAFHTDKSGNLFLMEPEMLNVFVINKDGTFSEIITPSIRTNLCFKGKLPSGEPVYDYSNGDGTRTIVTYTETGQKNLFKGEIFWSGETAFNSYGQAFFVDNKGLKCWNVVEGNIEIVCDRIEADTYEYLWMNDKEELFLISTGKNPYIVKLKNEPPQEVVEMELCITTESRYVEECAIAYNMRHPYVKINVSKVSSFDDIAMNKLFTEVSEGKGPDILVLNRSDLISFYNAGALSDLSTVLTNDVKDQIFPGVLDYGTIDGALVGITCEATIDTLFISNEIWSDESWTPQDALELVTSRVKAGYPIERVVASSITPYQMLNDLVLKDITNSGFVNPDIKKCSFDSEEFVMLLEHCKKYGKEATDSSYKDADERLTDLNDGKCLVYGVSGNFIRFSSVKAMLGEDYHCVGYPSEREQGSFLQFYDGCVAVNSQTSKRKAVNEFLSYLVEYSTQKKYGLNWVRKDVLADSVKDAVELYGYEKPVPVFFQSESEVIPLEGKEDGSSYVKEYIELAEGCITQKEEYEQINSIVIEEVQAFFNGQKTAKQVAEIIQKRVQLYLDEIAEP